MLLKIRALIFVLGIAYFIQLLIAIHQKFSKPTGKRIKKQSLLTKDPETKFKAIFEKSTVGKPLTSPMSISRYEQALRLIVSQNALQSAIINSPGDMVIFSIDTNYCYMIFNEKHRQEMKKVCGSDISNGMNLLDLMTDDSLKTGVRTSIDRSLSGEVFTEVQHQPDLDIYYELCWNPVLLNNEVVGTTCFKRDITARTRAEIALQAKNDELVRFTYTVSHDLKSPLVTIQTYLGYLQQDIQRCEMETLHKDIGCIQTAAKKMGDLLTELLNLSRVGHKAITPTTSALQEIIQEAMDLTAGQIADRGAKVLLPQKQLCIHGDRQRLVEVYQNLIDNAVKFMGSQPDPVITTGVITDNSQMVYFVKDNGIGIDLRHHTKVFGLFEKLDSSTEGSGLGLPLAKRIVELHGGKIWVKSDGPGTGSAFYFTLDKLLSNSTISL